MDLLSSDAAKRPKMHVTALHTTGLSHIHPVGTRWIKDSGLVSYLSDRIFGKWRGGLGSEKLQVLVQHHLDLQPLVMRLTAASIS